MKVVSLLALCDVIPLRTNDWQSFVVRVINLHTTMFFALPRLGIDQIEMNGVTVSWYLE